jgi:hypothetical protein
MLTGANADVIDPILASCRSLHCSITLQYRYCDLRENEIRVIDLYPGRYDSPLLCKLRNVSLLEKPRYESLSYCWGLNKSEAELECDNGSIAITKNLHVALQHLRDREKERTLWIDAVCINQQSLEERGQQVALMKQIFQRSHRTLVWLGAESRDSGRAIHLVRRLAGVWQRRKSQRLWLARYSTNIPPLYDPAWRAFALLLQRPWFQRAWVVQEASVAKDILVLCGADYISWDELMYGVGYAVDLGVFIAHGGSTTHQALRLYVIPCHKLNLIR